MSSWKEEIHHPLSTIYLYDRAFLVVMEGRYPSSTTYHIHLLSCLPCRHGRKRSIIHCLPYTYMIVPSLSSWKEEILPCRHGRKRSIIHCLPYTYMIVPSMSSWKEEIHYPLSTIYINDRAFHVVMEGRDPSSTTYHIHLLLCLSCLHGRKRSIIHCLPYATMSNIVFYCL